MQDLGVYLCSAYTMGYEYHIIECFTFNSCEDRQLGKLVAVKKR